MDVLLHTYKRSRLGQRHGLQSSSLTFCFYKNIYQKVVYVYFYKSIFQSRQIYSYGFHISKFNNLKIIHGLIFQCLIQTWFKTIFFLDIKGVQCTRRMSFVEIVCMASQRTYGRFQCRRRAVYIVVAHAHCTVVVLQWSARNIVVVVASGLVQWLRALHWPCDADADACMMISDSICTTKSGSRSTRVSPGAGWSFGGGLCC